MKFRKAFDVFCKTLRKDSELFYAYQSSIAMSFVDENRRQGSRDSYKKVHTVANQAAINFLNLLIKPIDEDKHVCMTATVHSK